MLDDPVLSSRHADQTLHDASNLRRIGHYHITFHVGEYGMNAGVRLT
jgi:hypothetical protein